MEHDEVETGLIFSVPDEDASYVRHVEIAFTEDPDWAGGATVWFDSLNYRCGHGSVVRESLEQEGVEIAPRALWQSIGATLLPEVPTDFLRCDVMERRAGRSLRGSADAPQAGDAWLASSLATSPLLRYRWNAVERDTVLDIALHRMLEGDDGETLNAARSLEPPARRWWHRATPRSPAGDIANLCIAAIEFGSSAASGAAEDWDAARELRMIAASMLDGPLYVPGLWPTTLDRILLRLDEHRQN